MPGLEVRGEWRAALAAAVYALLASAGIFAAGANAALAIGLAIVLLAAGLIERRPPAVDPALGAIAVSFLLLVWASTLWSIDPARTVRGALQMTGLLAAALVLIGSRAPLLRASDMIPRVALLASILGAALAALDFLAGHPIMRHVVAHPDLTGSLDTKFDRGLSYQCVLVWPLLAFGWARGMRGWALASVLALVLALALSRDDTGRLAFAVGLAVLIGAALLPRIVAAALAAIVACALSMPALVAAFAQRLIPAADSIKHSLAHRLEIWDYMAARASERPFGGWGWWSAQDLPIRPDELARYRYVTAAGSPHPHNNWLQLWVEIGAGGALLGAILALVLLNRALRLEAGPRPFALACFAATMVLSLASYDLGTDSWWGALAATGLLWRLLPVSAESA